MNTTITLAAVLIAFGGLISFANWWSLYWSYRTRRFHSTVPLFGAALLGAGMFVLSVTRPYCWMALILDYGTLALLLASPRIIQDVWDTSRFNLVREYLGQAGMKTAKIRLFRRSIFTIRLEIHRPPGECGLVDSGMVGTWQREGTQLTLRSEAGSAVFDVIRDAPSETLRQSVGFPSWESYHDYSLTSIEFVQIDK